MLNTPHETRRAVIIIGMLSALAVCLPADSYCMSPADREACEGTPECRYRSMHCFMTDVSEAWKPANLVMASLPVAFYGDDKAFRCLELAWKSLMISESATAILKLAVDRQRPDGSSHSRANSSFPSSHASSGFAVAYSIAHYYPKWSVPAYGMAALISYSRVYLDAHYASDVVVGAGIGIVAGYLASRYLEGWHVSRGALVEGLPLRIEVGDGLGSVRVYVSRRM
jgi:hypothetical protein